MTPTQLKVLRILYSRRGSGDVQLAGYGAAPLLSAAHALVRKGFAGTYRTGCFYLTDEGVKEFKKK